MSSNKIEVTSTLIDFLNQSPTPYHAVASMEAALQSFGFVKLDERQQWSLVKATSYYVTRDDSTICAWKMPSDNNIDSIRMIGTHTDSPCLKVKPQPEIKQYGTLQLGVEPYGGVLLSTWFDRDLSLAGRVVVKCNDQSLKTVLIDFQRAIGVIPSLAIHLNRTANSQHSINSQTDLPIIIGLENDKDNFAQILLKQIEQQYPHIEGIESIEAMDILAYDTQPASLNGINNSFINGARMDNLLSCYVGLQALIDSNTDEFSLLVCNDHEEVGSQSYSGAKGAFLDHVVHRILASIDSQQHFAQIAANSLFLSVDNAHAIHPNFPQLHDKNHAPIINAGPVIKINSNQSYATNAIGTAWIKLLAANNNIPLQQFVTRSDMGCGSTIGPITAAKMGINILDIGAPQWAMHSIRETVGRMDCDYLYQLLKSFYNHKGSFHTPTIV